MNQDQAKAWLPLIQAVADGKTLQIVKMNQGSREPVWCDVESSEFIYFNLGEYARFRIKPEPKKQWYRVGICKNLAGNVVTCLFQCETLEFGFENSPGFIRWLTDRIEYELPEGEA